MEPSKGDLKNEVLNSFCLLSHFKLRYMMVRKDGLSMKAISKVKLSLEERNQTNRSVNIPRLIRPFNTDTIKNWCRHN